jgi:hypothetical protein
MKKLSISAFVSDRELESANYDVESAVKNELAKRLATQILKEFPVACEPRPDMEGQWVSITIGVADKDEASEIFFLLDSLKQLKVLGRR